jgi:thiamine-monophosphate kinase
MLDVSDGLTGDLGHILDASGVGAVVELGRVPRAPALDALLAGPDRAVALQCLLAGGDDYELCFTAAAVHAPAIAAIATELDLPLTRIGRIVGEPGLVVRDERGSPIDPPRAYDHFAADAP